MNQYRLLLLVCLAVCISVFTSPLKAQEYTWAQVDSLAQRADTVIFRYHVRVPSLDEMLVFDNIGKPLDWREESWPRRSLFALKTNLLYDAISAVNLELEVPIGESYSVASELIFPWWLSDSRQDCFELLNFNVEGRYWFGSRENRAQLTGWSAGLYVGGGYYDLERNGKGYQGEHLLSGGVSCGYAHSIGGSARLEYSLGLGFVTTKFREYHAQKCDSQWLLVRQRYGRTTWFGPTRLRVSLVFMLNRKDKRGGVR